MVWKESLHLKEKLSFLIKNAQIDNEFELWEDLEADLKEALNLAQALVKTFHK